MRKYVSKEVICPFYKQEDKLQISCEGFCPSCTLQIHFTRRDVMHMHKEKHCNSFKGYPECPLFPAINEQYE